MSKFASKTSYPFRQVSKTTIVLREERRNNGTVLRETAKLLPYQFGVRMWQHDESTFEEDKEMRASSDCRAFHLSDGSYIVWCKLSTGIYCRMHWADEWSDELISEAYYAPKSSLK